MKPKFNIGEKVWIMYDNKAEEKRITGIRIGKTPDGEEIFLYGTKEPQNIFNMIYIQFEESQIFTSKEELLKSL